MKTSFLLTALLILGFASQAQSMKPDRDTRTAEIKKIQKSHTRQQLASLLKEFRKVDEELFPL